ncbi:hypothetical protein J0X14_04800 [Muricauda sp. CAU 1633]|uniref:hypothetical protein n=1 Tax=Allomuricauda sp. CAU 1633 TaxID=2816036 RepID=UPI001A90B939|nr:hypothetical protein [Muricauda sp. CAU 1633]MBO0321607.1 hypothetical protein [Muricauda sp. CAU 1633]
MKRLVVALALLISIGALAQRQEGHRMHKSPKMDMTAEQMATLQTKQMTLALDLTKVQQQKVMTINLDEAEFRKAKWDEMKALRESGERKKPTTEERFEMENARLDHQIAHQEKMREVLNDEQYQTWKKLRFAKAHHGKKKMQEKGRRG